MDELTQSIKLEAKRLGFDLVRVVDSKKSEDFVNRFHNNFDDWISEYPYKELSYLVNRETERFKLNAYLKNVQSIICLGINYYQIAKEEFNPLKHRKISRYAWGKDYHKVIEKRLKKLRSFIIEKTAEVSKKDFKLCVDTGPVLEKLIAMSAGVGFIGKNSLLITPEFGSWVFLSEIFTTIKLEPDEERKDLGECGTCEQCMTNCPTKALNKPCTLDPGKCISYLSIEHKDKISSDLYEKFNGWIYGCDICQEVCPHNKGKSKITTEETFTNHISGPYITREKLQNMTNEEFKKTFAQSPLKRTGLDKLKSLDKHIKVP